jgi:xanthine dehydrogenase accessory factor
MKKLIHSIIRNIEDGENFCLATIVASDGSTPRGPGTSMMIRTGASIEGTIGGGILEAETITSSQEILNHKKSVLKYFSLEKHDFDALDMTCGGRVEVLVQFVDAQSPDNIRLFQNIHKNIEKHEPFHLITPIYNLNGQPEIGPPFISIDGDGKKNPLIAEHRLESYLTGHQSYQVASNTAGRFIIQAITANACVYIFGGGHVGLKVYELARFIDMNVVVLDDRQEFANPHRFPEADEILVCDDYGRVFEQLPINRSSMIVIVTRGHRHDAEVLEQALRTEAGYIGMIGSRKKIRGIYDGLGKKGFPENDFKRVKAPIGLPIHAETPEEIAVSIVSEIIREKALLKTPIQ